VQDLLAPAFEIEETGAFRGFAPPTDPETVASKLEAQGESQLATDLRAARAELASQIRARQEARDAWEAWFGAWQGLPIRAGEPLETERPAYAGFGGATATAKMRLAHLGTVERGGETCAHLELRTSHGGPALAEAIRSTPALAQDPGMEHVAATIQGRTVEMKGLVGLATGRLHRVGVTVTTTFDDDAGGTRTLVDARDYALDWAQAETLPAAQAGNGARGAGAPGAKRAGQGAQARPQGKQGRKQGQQGQQSQQGTQGRGGKAPPKRN
jgi:hypothetical protein